MNRRTKAFHQSFNFLIFILVSTLAQTYQFTLLNHKISCDFYSFLFSLFLTKQIAFRFTVVHSSLHIWILIFHVC